MSVTYKEKESPFMPENDKKIIEEKLVEMIILFRKIKEEAILLEDITKAIKGGKQLIRIIGRLSPEWVQCSKFDKDASTFIGQYHSKHTYIRVFEDYISMARESILEISEMLDNLSDIKIDRTEATLIFESNEEGLE